MESRKSGPDGIYEPRHRDKPKAGTTSGILGFVLKFLFLLLLFNEFELIVLSHASGRVLIDTWSEGGLGGWSEVEE